MLLEILLCFDLYVFDWTVYCELLGIYFWLVVLLYALMAKRYAAFIAIIVGEIGMGVAPAKAAD